KRVKGADGWNRGIRGEHCDHAFSHFAGCLVGKGNGKNIFWSCSLVDQMKDTVSQGFCLSCSRSRNNKERSFGVEYGFLLLWIQGFEVVHRASITSFFRSYKKHLLQVFMLRGFFLLPSFGRSGALQLPIRKN